MKPLILLLLVGVTVQAQSVADAARRERQRQAGLRPSFVITTTESPNAEQPKLEPPPSEPAKTAGGAKQAAPDVAAVPKEASKPEAPKPQAPAALDPVQVYNALLDQLRAKIRTLQDQEMASLLQLNQANNQVYAPVTDPATQQLAISQVGDIQLKLTAVRKDLDDTRKALDAALQQGPPKK